MRACVTAGGGFLLAVLWFDLMFDVQARGRRISDAALASIAGYYARVTTAARPMNRLIGVVMLATLTAIGVQVVRGDEPQWVSWASLVLVGAAVGLAAAHTFPSAVRLGTRRDPPEHQAALARAILRDHVACLVVISSTLALQLTA